MNREWAGGWSGELLIGHGLISDFVAHAVLLLRWPMQSEERKTAMDTNPDCIVTSPLFFADWIGALLEDLTIASIGGTSLYRHEQSRKFVITWKRFHTLGYKGHGG